MTGADATDDALMLLALDEALAALDHDDVPVGAVVARRTDGEVIARRHNERERTEDTQTTLFEPASTPRAEYRLPDPALLNRSAPGTGPNAEASRPRPSAGGGSTTASSWSPSNRARCARVRS